MSLSSLHTPTGLFKNLKISTKKKLMFSNNIVRLNVVSSLAEADIDRQYLT